jgi:hypothetical protein
MIIINNKSLARHDFIVWGATLVCYYILPVWIIIPMARIMFVVFLAIAPNAAGIEVDFIAIMGFVGLLFEYLWRTSPVYWTLTAAYGFVVFILLTLVAVGYIFEARVSVGVSYLVENWNPFGFFPVALSLFIFFVDWLGAFLVPNFVLPWTFPLTWLLVAVFVGLGALWSAYAVVWSWLLCFVASGLVGYFVGQYLPSKLIAFLVAFTFHANIAFLTRTVEVGIQHHHKIPFGSPFNYVVSFIISLTWDCLLSNHYISFGSSQWVAFGATLAGWSVFSLFIGFTLPLLSVALVDDMKKQNQGEPEPTTN